MDVLEVIFQVGAEGGSLTLFGRKVEERWNFLFESLDQSEALVDEIAGVIKQSATYPSLYEVFKVMDRYPWHRLHPLSVHPSFRDQVHKEVLRRYANEGRMGRLPLAWEELLHEGE